MNKIIQDILTAYGAVLFSGRKRTGVFFMLATFINPFHGLIGLVGALTSYYTATLMKADSVYHKAGVFGASGLLTGLALSMYLKPTPFLFILVPLCSILAAFLTAAFIAILGWRFGLPSLALPFVFATWVGLLSDKIAIETGWLGMIIQPLQLQPLQFFNQFLVSQFPSLVDTFFEVISATSLQTNVLAGILILMGILLGTRISAIAMMIGAVIGMIAVLVLAGNQIDKTESILTAFNCVFAAGALGGVFILPNKRGIIYGFVGTILIALISIATLTYLKQEQVPPLALPFSVGVILLLLPVKLGVFSGIHLYPLASVGTAEANLRQYWRWLRQVGYPYTYLHFPHYGKWKVTQAVESFPTHTGVGKYSWDFMLLDESGKSASYPGLALTDYYGFGMPVLAPAAGTVVAVENRIQDNPPQGINTESPYGNYISIYHASGEYSIVAHLKKDSIKVVVGQPVYIGQEIAQVGNSGRSPEPHLHIALQNNWFPYAQSLPAKWHGLLIQRNGIWNYLPHQSPHRDDLASDFFTLNPISLEEFFTWSVLGAEWQYFIHYKSHSKEARLVCRPGLYGRFLLDDGAQVLQATKTAGHWQISTLDETDSDFKSKGKSDLLTLLFPAITILPVFAGTQYQWENEVSGKIVARRLKRLFELTGYGQAKSAGYQLRVTEKGVPHLFVKVQVTTESKDILEYDLTFEKLVGLVQATLYKNHHLWYSIDLQNYQSRLHTWTIHT